MGLIAHAGAVADACISFDASMVLTTGGADYGIMTWQVVIFFFIGFYPSMGPWS